MASNEIRFDNGEAYERYMGVWSQRVGDVFLDWLAPRPGLRWLDVGCGNGAFTETLVARCAPVSVDGIDPAEPQLVFARLRPGTKMARFRQGDAMALPYANDSFDHAVMPLVIFFVPEPAKGVAEMVRVVSAGGMVSAYAWDMAGHGFPYDALQVEMRALDLPAPAPPSADASRIEVMESLWSAAGLQDVQSRTIEVQRTFASFDDWWDTILGGPSVKARLTAMPAQQLDQLKERMRKSLPTDAAGRITYGARANAVKGRVAR